MGWADSVLDLGKEVQYYLQDVDLYDRRVQLAVVAVGITAIFLTRHLTKKRYNMPPGPRSWPVVGNLLCE